MSRAKKYFHRLNLSFLTIAMALHMVSPALAVDEPSEVKSSDNFALLVGIDDYKLAPLVGCVNDADTMRRAITDREKGLGFQDDDVHIKELLDQEGTRDAILESFRTHLIENAKKHKNGKFLFHFAGHGTRVLDSNSPKPDQRKQGIVTVDLTNGGHNCIWSPEINKLLWELSSYTDNIILVFDCCHSGTMTRFLNSSAKSATPRYMDQKLVSLRNYSEPQPGSDMPPLPLSKYVSFSACTSREVEWPTHDEKNGILTHYFADELKKAQLSWSFRDFRDAVRSAVSIAGYPTHPNLEGNEDSLVFQAGVKQSDPYIQVTDVTPDSKGITIEAGSAQGMQQGSIVAIYDRTASRLQGNEKKIAEGVITKVLNENSSEVQCKTLGDKPLDAESLRLSKVVLATPSFSSKPFRIGLVSNDEQPGAFANFVNDLKSTLNGQAFFETRVIAKEPWQLPEPSGDAFDVVITRDTFANFKKGRIRAPGKISYPDDALVYFLTTGVNGIPLFDVCVAPTDKDAKATILSALHKRSKQQALLGLHNYASNLDGKVAVRLIKGNDASTSDKVDQPEEPLLNIGDKFQLEIDNQSDENLYITVLSIGTSGSIKVIYPEKHTGQTHLSKLKSLRTLSRPELGPVGQETFKIIATVAPPELPPWVTPKPYNPPNFSFLEVDGISRVPISDEGNSLLRFLRNGVYRSRDPGDAVGEEPLPPTDSWTTKDFSVPVSDNM